MQQDSCQCTNTASSLCILTFEKDKANQFLLERVFVKNGYAVCVVEKASEVLERLATHNEKYDLLVINVCAPIKADLELVRKIRSLADKHNASIPIVATTTAIHPDIKKLCQAEGIIDVIMKPFNIQELANLVEQAIRCSDKNLKLKHSTEPVS